MKQKMRPSTLFFLVCFFLVAVTCVSIFINNALYLSPQKDLALTLVVEEFHLTDPCVATEARYTRNPSISDPIVPVMDHPGAFEHFPTGSFWAPPQKWD